MNDHDVDIEMKDSKGNSVHTSMSKLKEAADSMRAKHDTEKIASGDFDEGLIKAKFEADKITVHYQVDRRDTKEVHKPTIHDPGHADLHVQRREVARKVLHLMGAPESWKETGGIIEIRQDLETLELKFKLGVTLEWHPKPFVLETPALNDLTFNDVEPLLVEIAKFVTGEKRHQAEFDFAD